MIDLTPLDIRKKREDFRKALRGYDPEEVDAFLTLVSERLEELVKENLTLRERVDRLQEQVSSQLDRERAVQEALVTAQRLRDDIQGQAQREAEEMRTGGEREAKLVRKEAEVEAQEIVGKARRQLEERMEALDELERRRLRFLRSFRALLEREMDVIEVEEARTPLQDTALDLDFLGGESESEPEAQSEQRSQEVTHEEGPVAGAPSGEGHAEGRGEGPAEEAAPSPSEDEAPPADEESSEDDPKRWLSSLVERELSEKTDQDSWS
jgi:cell division initiation protein